MHLNVLVTVAGQSEWPNKNLNLWLEINIAFIHNDIRSLFSLSQIILIIIVIKLFLLMKSQLILIRHFAWAKFF